MTTPTRRRSLAVAAALLMGSAIAIGGAAAGAHAAQNPDNAPLCWDGDVFYGCTNPPGPHVTDTWRVAGWDEFGRIMYQKVDGSYSTEVERYVLMQQREYGECTPGGYADPRVTCY